MAINGRDVLVVEDDAEMNRLVGAYARLSGFNYRGAVDGAAGVRQAQENRPAIVLLDLMLPDIDGFEVCRQLKSDARTADVPVIFLTALDQAGSRARGESLGAVDYITKPFDPDELISAIRKHASTNGHAA